MNMLGLCQVYVSHKALEHVKVKVKAKVTLRLAVYGQSVRLAAKPLEANDHRFFFFRGRVRVALGLAVYRQSFRLGAKSLETHDNHFFFQLNPCGHIPYVTFSLPRGWVCGLKFLLALASAVILGSGSRGTPDHILLSVLLLRALA
jgi:hypothetical protein